MYIPIVYCLAYYNAGALFLENAGTRKAIFHRISPRKNAEWPVKRSRLFLNTFIAGPSFRLLLQIMYTYSYQLWQTLQVTYYYGHGVLDHHEWL